MFTKRFSALNSFVATYLLFSFIIRTVFFIWAGTDVDFSITSLIRTYTIGMFFDLGTISFFVLPYSIYLILVGAKIHGSKFDKITTYSIYFLLTFILMFSFFAEITFWDEFKNRFNFIAVDYLIYTYEVVANINESYPLPLLIGGVVIVTLLILFTVVKLNKFDETFNNKDTKQQKLTPFFVWLLIALSFTFFIDTKIAEWSTNRYNNEITKSGIYSFFGAFRNNELPYNDFYKTIAESEALTNVKKLVFSDTDTPVNAKNPLERIIHKTDSTAEQTPNVIFICIESLSGSFIQHLGGTQNITPVLDSLADKGLFFSNLFATGTRTIRGMEAITLAIPPTPGRSIVKRQNNTGLFNIGEVFKQKGYSRAFFYGGDGYFDNMNQFFGGNGFDIVDRGRGYLLGDDFTAKRTNIEDNEVTFENAWGVCDADIYNKVIKEADLAHQQNKPFFNFVMTTSNHRPYTYPANKIDIPSGTSREGAVKYTDYAIGEFIKMAKTKAWYNNTVFVIMSDHCASSAGSSEIDVANYKIPAIIFNLKNQPTKNVGAVCSQIDLFPTLFSMLNWKYQTSLFGKNILSTPKNEERAFVGNYSKVGLLKNNKVVILDNKKGANYYQWDIAANNLISQPTDDKLVTEAVTYYQAAYYIYINGLLKLNN